MKKEEKKAKKKDRILKGVLVEIRDSILFEVVWRILFFIPRMVIRLVKDIF